MRADRFREDLYYRLNVVSDRAAAAARAAATTSRCCSTTSSSARDSESGNPTPRLSAEAMQCLMSYSWPGNVRELMNVIERAVLFSSHGLITAEALPDRLRGVDGAPPAATDDFATLDEVIERHVARVLERTGGNHTRAARILGISRRTLHRMAERKRRDESPAPGQDDAGRDELTHLP